MESSDSGTGPDWRFIHFGLGRMKYKKFLTVIAAR